MPYDSYVRKRSKHVRTDSYLYLARNLAKCMTRLNSHVDPVRMGMASTQKIPNSQVCSMEERKPKGIKADKRLSHVCSTDKREPKRFIVNACSSDESESKSVHISINKKR